MIKKVQLENFRNYKKAEVSLTSDLVLILGNNAAGKTNFIESLYFISNLKSFRSPDLLLANSEADHFTIKVATDKDQLEVVVQTKPMVKRVLKSNGQRIKKTTWQPYRTVLFAPNDLNLFILGPTARRKYLNEVLAQKNKIYAASLASLEHVLKQKAALLNDIFNNKADVADLLVWNEQLIELSNRIVSVRQEFFAFLEQRFPETYKNLTGFSNKFSIEYKTQNITLENLKAHEQAEIRSGQNLIGPHRDDFILRKDGESNVYNSSRGELRSQVLTVKLLQAEYLSDKERPLVLLDDVFSELDEIRRAKLIESLSGSQIFITSTEEHHLPKLTKNVQLLKVENNSIA